MSSLSDLEVRILAFEHQRWIHPGAREQAIKDELDLSVHRYEQIKTRLLDRPEAYLHDPVLVKRLRRLRDTRRARRTG